MNQMRSTSWEHKNTALKIDDNNRNHFAQILLVKIKMMWIIWAVLAAISAALVIVLTKAGLKNVDPNLAFAIQAVMILLITWSVVTYQGNFAQLNKLATKDWLLLIAAGIATTLSTLFSYQALSSGSATAVVTIERSSLVFAILLSVIFLKEKLTWQIALGAVFVLTGAILIAVSKPA
jgi:transporter family protein